MEDVAIKNISLTKKRVAKSQSVESRTIRNTTTDNANRTIAEVKTDDGANPVAKPVVERFRSLQFLPYKSIGKMAEMSADWFVIDMEDSVAFDKKDSVREQWSAAFQSINMQEKRIIVRVNGLSDREHLDKDLAALINSNVDALLLPMLESADDVKTYARLVEAAECQNNLPNGRIKFICLLETARSIISAYDIAMASERNIALSFGHADLLNNTAGQKSRETLVFPRSMIVMAARAANLEVIDTPFFELNDVVGFEQESRLAKELGFSGIFILHPSQLNIANRVFSETLADVERANRIISNGKDGCYVDNGTILGPPFVKRLEKIKKTGHFEFTPKVLMASKIGRSLQLTASLEEIVKKGRLSSPYEITVTESWITQWHSICFSGNPTEFNAKLASNFGLNTIVLPYNLLLAYILSTSVEVLTERCYVHLSIHDAEYSRPVYPGDTLRAEIIVLHVDETSKDRNTILTTLHTLIDQSGQIVFKVKKKTLYRESVSHLSEHYLNGTAKTQRQQDSRPESLLKDTVLDFVPADLMRMNRESAKIGHQDLLIHGDIRLLGRTENAQFNSLFRNTLPLHGNYARYREREIVTCGLMILPIVLGIASRDIKYYVHHDIHSCYHVNKVHPNASLGAISFIADIQDFNDHYDVVSLRTLGVKDVDVAAELAEVPLPMALFKQEFIPPSVVERIVDQCTPQLLGKIVLVCDWQIFRPK